ncbi:MAG: helix-turn-helix domain-containing protein [Polaromonas sp.]|nr:helix-turn-helix domain-containing protein [Polaromonas sp.]
MPSKPLLPKKARPLRIAILAYAGCMATEIFAVADVLLIASHVAHALRKTASPPFDVQVVGLGARMVTVAGGFAVGVQRPAGVYDLLVVPGPEIRQLDEWDSKLAPLRRELAYIRKSFSSGTPVAAVCIGTFLLGEAGLLDGRKATTAWLCAGELTSRYPATTLHADAVLVEDGAITTTGAVSSAFDLAIHLVKKTLGAEVATATARLALLSQPRASQAPFVDSALLAPTGLPSFAHSVAQWLGSRLTEPYDLERLAQAFHVSTRTLLRRVKAQTGDSPLALLQQARVDKAKQLLNDSAWSIAQITEAVGYADVPTFSRLFASRVGESPARYRRRQA